MAQTQGPTPAARIFRDRSGKICAVHCIMTYSAPLRLDAAIEKAKTGKTVFVAREDVHAILDALGVPAV
jgi:hypothetical protein